MNTFHHGPVSELTDYTCVLCTVMCMLCIFIQCRFYQTHCKSISIHVQNCFESLVNYPFFCLPAGPATNNYKRPKPQSPHPGDQLANVMSNDGADSLFMDPSWKDPNLGGLGPGAGVPPRLAQSPPPSMHSSSAADPFSQLSLSRGPSGGQRTAQPPPLPHPLPQCVVRLLLS